MKPLTAILIGAGSRGAKAYAPYALEHPDRIRFIAVAELDEQRREAFRIEHNLPEDMVFSHSDLLLNQNIPADVAFVCTQDNQHKQPALRALDAGYHLVLEKPIAPNLADSEEIVAKAVERNRMLIICHVLRYTAFFSTLKKLIDSGELGDILSITLNENVGYAHAAHSYVRGNWRKESLSSPMLLAKSCHDMDLLFWLMGRPCTQVSSFGALNYFTAANAPTGSAHRCLDGCKAKEACPFDAEKIYMDPAITAWPVNIITADLSQEGRSRALREGPYGRCVFHCDNDVVDHQVVDLRFDNDATANFAMNSLSSHTYRAISVYGTKGQVDGVMEEDKLRKAIYGKEDQWLHTRPPGETEYGHGGGDAGLMDHVVQTIASLPQDFRAVANDAIVSHRICFAAEKARRNSCVVKL